MCPSIIRKQSSSTFHFLEHDSAKVKPTALRRSEEIRSGSTRNRMKYFTSPARTIQTFISEYFHIFECNPSNPRSGSRFDPDAGGAYLSLPSNRAGVYITGATGIQVHGLTISLNRVRCGKSCSSQNHDNGEATKPGRSRRQSRCDFPQYVTGNTKFPRSLAAGKRQLGRWLGQFDAARLQKKREMHGSVNSFDCWRVELHRPGRNTYPAGHTWSDWPRSPERYGLLHGYQYTCNKPQGQPLSIHKFEFIDKCDSTYLPHW